jgi:hypothetical protein
MEPKTLKSRIDAILKASLVPHLKEAGFRKRGRTFRRQLERHWRIVSVHGGNHNTNLDVGSVGSFSVDLGIFFPDAFAIGGVELGRDPGIHECFVTLRLGNSGSRWGCFDDLAGDCPSDEAQTESLNSDWRTTGLMWFDKHATPESAYRLARAQHSWPEALYLAIAANDISAASDCLANCNNSLGGMNLEYVQAIAAKHGVR